jgi:GTPase SAR1 family protein
MINLWECENLSTLSEATFANCPALKTLSLRYCKNLAMLPESIFTNCHALATLDLEGCDKLSTLPETIFENCCTLMTLNLEECYNLLSLPESIVADCPELMTLNLCGCKIISALPEPIGDWTKLASLNIRGTAITRLPGTIIKLKETLTQIECNRTDPLIFPPAAVLGTDGHDAGEIATHTWEAFGFMEATEQSATQLTRDRLMLIGDGGSGKTTLKTALLWSPATAERVRMETKRKLGAWTPSHVRQWILEISDGHDELADKFSGGKISGTVLLALNVSDVAELCKGTHRNDVVDKIARMIALLNAHSATSAAAAAAPTAAAPPPVQPVAEVSVVLDTLHTPTAFVEWLRCGLGTSLSADVAEALEENDITGDVASEMTETDWEKVVPQATFGVRRKILKRIATCLAATKQLKIPAQGQASVIIPRNTLSYAPLLDLPHVWTVGIEVESWTDGGYELWDFAGQLEYYPAHQFFLSASNTVYLLVADTSKGSVHCVLRLQHWLSFVRSALGGADHHYGTGADQLVPVQVLLVATHTDTPVFQRGIDFLPELVKELAGQFAPKIKVHGEAFKMEYSAVDGGGLAGLKQTLQQLRGVGEDKEGQQLEQQQRPMYPTSYAEAFAALKTSAGGDPERSVMQIDAVRTVISECGIADESVQDTVLTTLEAFGMVKKLGETILIEPVTWLTKITSAFVAPKLQAAVAGYETEVDPIPSIAAIEVKAMLRERGAEVDDVDAIVNVLVALKLCFVHWRYQGSAGSNPPAILPAILPATSAADWSRLHTVVTNAASGSASHGGYGRRFRCSRLEDSIPATLMATIQATLYAVADDILLLRAGTIVVKLFDCVVLVRLSTPKATGDRTHQHQCSDVIDVVVVQASTSELGQHAMDLVVLVVVGAWNESFSSIMLVKSGICTDISDGGGGFMLNDAVFEQPLTFQIADKFREIIQSRVRSNDAERDAVRKFIHLQVVSGKPDAVQSKYTADHQQQVFDTMLNTALNTRSHDASRAIATHKFCLLTDPVIVIEMVDPSVDPTRFGLAPAPPTPEANDAGAATPPTPTTPTPLSEIELAVRAGDDEQIQLLLARPSLSEASIKTGFVPIKDRGGGIALESAMPRRWRILKLELSYWRKLFATAKLYIQDQIELYRPADARKVLHAASEQLDNDKKAYDAAFESIRLDVDFTRFESKLSELADRVCSRCRDMYNGKGKPEQRSSNLVEVYRDAKSVEQKFAILLAELQNQVKCPCTVAPVKQVFRCIEKMGLDPARQWDAKILTDVVRGTAVIDGMGIGLQLIQVLMACDEDEASTSPYTKGGSIITAKIGDSIVMVGVKNRWSDEGAGGCGGWRDAQIKFFFKSDPTKHICEVQVSHKLLDNVRKGMGLHHIYGSARNAKELLEVLGAL